MYIKWPVMVTAFAVSTFGLSASAAPADPADKDAVPLTLSGCVVAGEEDDSFLLTNVVIDGNAPRHAFYRFNTTKGLDKHVGYRVEVQGTADLDDVDDGTLRVRTGDRKVTTEVTSERRSVKVEDVWFGSTGAVKVDADVPTYKFEVKKIQRLAGDCSSAPVAR